MQHVKPNVDAGEIAKFQNLAHRWWDTNGEFKALHDINPLRLDYIDWRARLNGKRVLDVGCGGGILTEGMARRGAAVIGIDLAETSLSVARAHARESGFEIGYRNIALDNLAAEQPESFDIITCMEMLEHVPDPAAVVTACARLVKPDGHVFFSTINRNAKSFLFAIVGAEYILRLLPKGTHEYARFICPAELSRWARGARLEIKDITGMTYNPITRSYRLGRDVAVNYFVHTRKG
jgi:2-polyprenyl-6-hydroxyphenyl methylase / 3-demethylubiquinone-9 3-methyltransferase